MLHQTPIVIKFKLARSPQTDINFMGPHYLCVGGFWVPALGDAANSFVGDSTRHRYEFPNPEGHNFVFAGPVRLKFYLHRARLYSFWLEPKSVR
jgi:hypothetical protein